MDGPAVVPARLLNGKYINLKKIEKTKPMVLPENHSIQELSYKLGFENVSYFNKLFKKLTGESPSSYKKALQHVQQI